MTQDHSYAIAMTARVRGAVREAAPVSSYLASEALYRLLGGKNLRFFLKRARRKGKDRWWVSAEGSPGLVLDPLGDPPCPSIYGLGIRVAPLSPRPGKRTESLMRSAMRSDLLLVTELGAVAYPSYCPAVAKMDSHGDLGFVVRLFGFRERDLKRYGARRAQVSLVSSGVHDRATDAIEEVVRLINESISDAVLAS